jgi:hypothetical protein
VLFVPRLLFEKALSAERSLGIICKTSGPVQGVVRQTPSKIKVKIDDTHRSHIQFNEFTLGNAP